MPRTLTLALLLASLLLPASSALAAKSGYRAEIRRTEGGVPHVKAEDYGSLGFGLGYAYAEDQLCEYASMIVTVTVTGQRSRYFGSEAESPNGGTNLQSDFFWQRIKDAKTVERLVKRRTPHGPAKAVRQTIRGFAAGYNAGLAALRRPDEAVLAGAVAADALQRVADRGRPGLLEAGGDRAQVKVDARGIALVVVAVSTLQVGARSPSRCSRPAVAALD